MENLGNTMKDNSPEGQYFLPGNNSRRISHFRFGKELPNKDIKASPNFVHKSSAQQVEFQESEGLHSQYNACAPNTTPLDKKVAKNYVKITPVPVSMNKSFTEQSASPYRRDLLPVNNLLPNWMGFDEESSETYLGNPLSPVNLRRKKQMTPPERQDVQSVNNTCARIFTRLDEEKCETNQNGAYFSTEKSIEPMFEDYQLIGDSQLLRFSEQLLFFKSKTDPFNGARALGLCVSGQTVGDLRHRIFSKKYVIHEKVILLIGTNDMIKGTPLETMKSNLTCVLRELKRSTKEIILLTLPAVPCLSSMNAHWYRLTLYNSHIKSHDEAGRYIRVADVAGLFSDVNRRCYMDNFELFYSDMKRKDGVHLNREGLKKIHNFLCEKMF